MDMYVPVAGHQPEGKYVPQGNDVIVGKSVFGPPSFATKVRVNVTCEVMLPANTHACHISL